MSGMVKFGFEGHEVRTQHDHEGEVWFCVNDICAPLAHSNPRKAVEDLVDEGDVTRRDTPTSSGVQSMNFVNESGMYALVLGSRLETAKRFKRWVTHEVLPTIRKTGGYAAGEAKPAKDVKMLNALRLEAKERRLNAELLMRTLKIINEAKPLHVDVFVATAAVVAETAAGRELPALKPKTEGEWMTPTLIAEQLGVTAARVGLTITELNIRGNIDGVARAVLNKAAYSDKTVTTYQYTPRALEMIRARLQEAPKLEPVN